MTAWVDLGSFPTPGQKAPAVELMRQAKVGRFGVVTDDPKAWRALPDELTASRKGSPAGYSWALSPSWLNVASPSFRSPLMERTVRKHVILGLLPARRRAGDRPRAGTTAESSRRMIDKPPVRS